MSLALLEKRRRASLMTADLRQQESSQLKGYNNIYGDFQNELSRQTKTSQGH